ncbi:MAG: guanine permease [Gammaproteobacteria bacterium RIFCSPHIGHO2_12_FULL_35_23]|nr:MAG: guanine permease [Gammaproteobacteria bacterium RIFCSPHIGHO2_12_FULL_35_23]
MPKLSLLTNFFKLRENHTSIRTEITAGFTTFLTMAYIIFVNPAILAQAGMPYGDVFTATCLTAIAGCFLIGLLANYPIAIAPGLGLNAYFTYMIVLTFGYSWQTALGAVLIAGVFFFLLTIFKIRQWIINAIPQCIITATAAGIGLFIGMIALKNAGIITGNSSTLLTLGNLTSASALLALLGFFLIAALDHFRIAGSIIMVIIFISLIALLLGKTTYYGLVSLPPAIHKTFLAANVTQLFTSHGLMIIFTFVIVALFDSSGTLIGVLHDTNLIKHETGKKRLSRALTADSLATIIGSLLGTSTTATFIESAAGIKAGGRTGLTAITVSIFFIFALFLSPLAKLIPTFASTPALLFIACMMLKNMKDIHWDDLSEAIPSAITMMMIPYGFSIASGIGLGFISYTVIKIFCGKARELKPALILLTLIFAVYFLRQAFI